MRDYLTTQQDTSLQANDRQGGEPEVSFSEDRVVFTPSVVDTVGAEAIFGDQVLYGAVKDQPKEPSSAIGLPFAAVEFFTAVVLVCLYCYVLSTYAKLVSAVLRSPFSAFTEKNLLSSNDLNVSRLLSFCRVLLFLVLSLVVADFGQRNGVEGSFLGKFHFMWAYVLLFLLVLYRFLLLRVIKWYSQSDDFFFRLNAKIRLIIAFLVILVVPILLFTIFGKSVLLLPESVVLLVVALCWLFLQIKIALFFKAEKISFLQYILYFCAVDLIPLSFLYVFIWKS